MKRNLFAVFLAVMLVSALVFFVAPSAKAADATVVQATADGELKVDTSKILDLNGFDVTVTVTEGETLRVIDTANKKDTTKVGTLKNNGAGSIAPAAQDPSSTMYFAAIATTVDNVTTYQFHPFNLMISQVGINTIAKNSSTKDETDTTVAICLRGTYGANNKVLSSGVITDYGLCTVSIDNGEYVYGTPISAKSKYAFDEKFMHAYFDLASLLDTDNIDSTYYYCTYVTVNGEPVYSPVEEITPREVLKKIIKKGLTPTDAQKGRIEDFVEAGNSRVGGILSNLQLQVAQDKTYEISFENTDQRTSFSTTEQVWKNGDLTFTNSKANSSNNVADYSNPVRLYKSSTVTISVPGMKEIIFESNGDADYKTALQGTLTKAGLTYENSDNTYTVTLSTTTDSITLTLEGQIRLNSISVNTTTVSTISCAHAKNASEATCTTQAQCLDCDAFYGDTADHAGGTASCTEQAKCDTCGISYGDLAKHTGGTATCTAQAKCDDCGNSYGEKDLINGHNYDGHTCKNGCGIDTECIDVNPQDNACDICSKALGGEGTTTEIVWKLVTDVNSLKAGDKIVIVAKSFNYALSTTQNGNNRGQASVTKVDNTITFGDDVQIITLEAGTAAGTFAFNVGNGYLYAASSGSNHLKTQTKNDANSSWLITIASDGTATIKAQGTNTRNWLRYNSTNNPPIFSCYASGQNDVVIYKQTTIIVCDHTGGSATCADLAECEKCGEPYGELAEHSYPADSHDCIYGCTTKSECVDANPQDNVCDICSKELSGSTKPELTTKTYSYIFTGKQFSANGTKTLGGVNWTLAGNGGYWGYDGTKGQQFGSGNAPYKSMTLTSESFNNVSKIVINTSGASDIKGTLTVSVGGTDVGTITLTKDATSYTFNVSELLDGPIVLSYSQTSTKAIYIKSIDVTYAE